MHVVPSTALKIDWRMQDGLSTALPISVADDRNEFEERRADEQILEPLRQEPGALCAG